MARPSFDPGDQTLDLIANEQLLQESSDMGVAIPVADLLQVRLQAAGARGWGEEDLAELTEACRMETGFDGAEVPELGVSSATPIASRATEPGPPHREEVAPPKEAVFPPKGEPQPVPPTVAEGTWTAASPVQSSNSVGDSNPKRIAAFALYTATDGEGPVTLELERTSHFEVIKGQVWACCQGKHYQTTWRSLGEVELAFHQVLFLFIQRRVLLRPEAVLEFRSTFGGGAKARVEGNIELRVSRSAASRLKVLLGI
jgi:hypothetical protein